MGRLAQVFSVGVRGSVDIELPKQEFFAGEVLVGHVKLSVKEPIDAEGFVLTLVGKEHISWHIQHGKQSHYRHLKHEIIHQQIQLIGRPTVFEPSDHIFPFQIQLPPNLPSSFALFKPNVQQITRAKCSILYKLKADTKVKGILTADLGNELAIGIHALPMLPVQPPRPLEDSTTRPVFFMCCFNQGPCHISGTTNPSAVDLVNGFLQVKGSVRNESKRAISAVSVQLYQDFTVHIPTGFPHSGFTVVNSRLIHEVQCGGVQPGSSRDDVSVDVYIPQVVANVQRQGNETNLFGDGGNLKALQPFPQFQLTPTTDLVFVSIGYHVAIHCSIPWHSDVTLELPLQLFQPPFSVVAPVPPPAFNERLCV